MDISDNILTWRILIVDDEPDNLNLANDVLTLKGATTATADAGQTALDLIDVFNPNLILLDLGMPEMDGWQVHRQLRARPDLDHVPIIALTALAMASDAEKVRAAGFDGYIPKPFRVKSLVDDLSLYITGFLEHKAKQPSLHAEEPKLALLNSRLETNNHKEAHDKNDQNDRLGHTVS